MLRNSQSGLHPPVVAQSHHAVRSVSPCCPPVVSIWFSPSSQCTAGYLGADKKPSSTHGTSPRLMVAAASTERSTSIFSRVGEWPTWLPLSTLSDALAPFHHSSTSTSTRTRTRDLDLDLVQDPDLVQQPWVSVSPRHLLCPDAARDRHHFCWLFLIHVAVAANTAAGPGLYQPRFTEPLSPGADTRPTSATATTLRALWYCYCAQRRRTS